MKRRFTIRIRLTLLYGFLMSLLIVAALAILFSISSQEILSSSRHTVEARVSNAFNHIHFKHDKLEFDNDLLELEDGVYLSIYNQQEELLYGRIPYGFVYDLAFKDGVTRRVSAQDSEYYVLDLTYTPNGSKPLLVRGVLSISDAEESFRYTLQLSLFILPALLIGCCGIGYFMAKRALSPVATINERVNTILEEHDYSKRVKLGEGHDELYEMSATFDHLLEQVDDSLRRERQFTSDVSHELRTPLSIILLQIDSLMDTMPIDSPSFQEASVIREKAQAMHEIIAQLLLLSRADMGTAQIQKEDLNFSELSEFAIEEARMLAEEKQITIKAEIQPDLYLMGDQTLLIRFWMNLLQNAIRYGKQNGFIHVQVIQKDEEIFIQVEDNGIGISQEDLPHIWERFYQADLSRSSSLGFGLGLSMVKWIVEEHQGRYDVTSVMDEGTSFQFYFPVFKKDSSI